MNDSFERNFVGPNLRNEKWLLGFPYNPHEDKINSYLNNLSTALDKLWKDFENTILLRDFNVEVENKYMSEFMSVYSLRNLVKQKTFFKNPENLSRIDLILTKSPKIF